MVLEINNIDVRAGEEAAFAAAFARCVPILLRVQGCRAATLLRCIEEPGRYLVQVEWKHLSDHVDRYPSTPEAAEVRALLLPLIAQAAPAHFKIV